jgi:hypothetical protein
MYDQLKKEQAKNKELGIRIFHLEQAKGIGSVQPVSTDALMTAEKINELLKNRMDIYQQEQRKILDTLNQIKDRNTQPESFDRSNIFIICSYI